MSTMETQLDFGPSDFVAGTCLQCVVEFIFFKAGVASHMIIIIDSISYSFSYITDS